MFELAKAFFTSFTRRRRTRHQSAANDYQKLEPKNLLTSFLVGDTGVLRVQGTDR